MPTPTRAAASLGKLPAKPESARDHPAPIPALGQPPERYSEQSVEDGEGGAVEEADLVVAKVEAVLDAGREDRDDLPVDEIDHVDQEKHKKGVPGVAADARPCRLRVGHARFPSIVLRFASG